jgi:hypothetical protein
MSWEEDMPWEEDMLWELHSLEASKINNIIDFSVIFYYNKSSTF